MRLRVEAPGAEEPAVSGRWLVWRAREPAGDVLRVLDLTAPDSPPADIRRARAPDRIGRPSIDGDRVVYHFALRARQQRDRGDLPADAAAHAAAHRSQRRPAAQPLRAGRHAAVRQLVVGAPARPDRPAPRPHAAIRTARLFAMHPVARRDAGHERGRERHGAGYPGGKAPKFPERAPEGVDASRCGAPRSRPAPRTSAGCAARAEGTSNTILRLAR